MSAIKYIQTFVLFVFKKKLNFLGYVVCAFTPKLKYQKLIDERKSVNNKRTAFVTSDKQM